MGWAVSLLCPVSSPRLPVSPGMGPGTDCWGMQTQESYAVNGRHITKGLRGSVLLTSGPLLLSPCSWLHRVENSK